MKKIIINFWPIFFIPLVWFIFASPYFLKNKVPYASTYQMDFFPPWSHYIQFKGPVKNNAMPDVHTQIYPWKKLTVETLKSGQVPLWNPYNFAGNPHLANFQTAVLSPFNLLFFVLPFLDAWSLLILFQPLLAGLFTYFFVRSLKISRLGSLVSAITFMFCGFITVWMAYGTLAYAILYLPLALWAVEKYYESRRFKFLFLLSGAIPLSFFSGHFQISLYFLSAVIAYIVFKWLTCKNLLAVCYLLLAVCLGVLLSLPQLLPSLNLYFQSVRSELFLLSEAIPLPYLLTVIAPDFFGNPVTRNDWFGHYAEWAGFVGVWPLFLAVLAVAQKSKKSLFFCFLGLISLALAVNSPLSSIVVFLKIPVISTSALSRIIVLFSFATAVLAGFGLDELKNIFEKNEKKRKLFLVLAGGISFIGLIWIVLIFGKGIPEQWLIVAKRNFLLPTVLLTIGAFLLILSFKFKWFSLFAICYLLFAISFDGLHFAQKWMPFDPRALVYPDIPLIKAIKENIGQGRIFGNLGAEVNSYYGFPSLEGYDPLYIGRYGEFIRGAENNIFLKGERSIVRLSRNLPLTDRVFDVLGVSLIFHPIADTNQNWAYPVWQKNERYEIIYRDDKFELYKNKRALPRASLFYGYQVISDNRKILKTFYNPDFDFRKILILEKNPGVNLKEGQGQTEIILYSPDQIEIKAKTNGPALLFLADNFYPSWEATVNGKKAEIFRADYSFRAVLIPRGESIVKFNMRWF